MNPEFRERAFLPLILPLVLLGGLALYAVSLSRVLLAIPEMGATFLALVVAGYVLVLSGMLAARPHVSTRTLGVGLVLGLLGVTVAGALGASAGIREIHHDEEAAADEEPADDAEAADNGAAAEEIPDDALVWVSIDIEYAESPDSAEAGEITMAIDNTGGNLEHDVTIEEEGDTTVVTDPGGGIDVGTITLDPGTYTYYCSVPGHRSTMEGTLEVE
jgi:plastocyanin